MCYGFWVQDSDEILAHAQAGMRILAARSVTMEPSDRGQDGDVCAMASGCNMRTKFLLLLRR